MIGELATDGHALTDGNAKSLKSVNKWNNFFVLDDFHFSNLTNKKRKIKWKKKAREQKNFKL